MKKPTKQIIKLSKRKNPHQEGSHFDARQEIVSKVFGASPPEGIHFNIITRYASDPGPNPIYLRAKGDGYGRGVPYRLIKIPADGVLDADLIREKVKELVDSENERLNLQRQAQLEMKEKSRSRLERLNRVRVRLGQKPVKSEYDDQFVDVFDDGVSLHFRYLTDDQTVALVKAAAKAGLNLKKCKSCEEPKFRCDCEDGS